MRSTLLATFAAATLLTTLAVPAGALPAIPKPSGVETGAPIPIADGCGRGWHYSWRWRRCVRNWGWYPR